MDRTLIEYIYNFVDENKLWITEFSKDLFEGRNYNLFDGSDVEDIKEDYLFVENCSVKSFEDKIDEIILFNWNRVYPADLFFDISLEDWNHEFEMEIEGFSHEKISIKIYKR